MAVFHDDGTGEWRELGYGVNGLNESNALYPFKSEADIVVNARLAADSVGATKMDRPEWVSVSPLTGEVYVTLTNNKYRGEDVSDKDRPKSQALNAANPRSYLGKGNHHGHIIRFAPQGEHNSKHFVWDIYLFTSPSDLTAQNLSNLSPNNDFSSPDGLFFDPRGVLWIQTDDSAFTNQSNCMLLAALPGKVGDGEKVTTSAGKATLAGQHANNDTLRRFFVGPKGCEITGITLTPDYKTLFVNIQHPGEDEPSVSWGAVQAGGIPRSATVMITKKDGGEILSESYDK